MSTSKTTIDLFAAFQSLSEAVPEMRCGQLIAAVGEVCSDLHGRGLWEASDAELLEAVWQFRRNLESRDFRRAAMMAAAGKTCTFRADGSRTRVRNRG